MTIESGSIFSLNGKGEPSDEVVDEVKRYLVLAWVNTDVEFKDFVDGWVKGGEIDLPMLGVSRVYQDRLRDDEEVRAVAARIGKKVIERFNRAASEHK